MDRAYESDKTLAKTHGFHAVVPPKKNRKLTWLYDKQLYKHFINNEILPNDTSLLEIFLFVTTNLILFLFQLSLSLLFSIYFLCERCLV